jgi:hypothetical protein
MKSEKLIFIQVIVLLLVLKSSHSFDYVPSPVPEFNPGRSGNFDANPIVAILSNGLYVVTFTGTIDSKTKNVFFAIYDSSGKVIKDATRVNPDSGFNTWSWVAADNAGGFAVTWNRKDGSGQCCFINDVYVRYYDSTYTAGPAVKVNAKAPSQYTNQQYATVAYTGNYFFTCFNPDFDSSYSYTIYSEQYLLSTLYFRPNTSSNIRIGNISKGNVQYGCVALDLKNGTFVIAYHTTEFGDFDLVFTILREKDYSVVKPLTRINTNLKGQQANPIISLLTTKDATPKFIIVWWDLGTPTYGDVLGQFIDINGNFIGVNFKINTISNCSFPAVKTLGDDGFVVMYRSNKTGSYNIYYQLLTNDGKLVGPERKVNTTTESLDNQLPYVDASPGKHIMMVYSSTKNNYAQIFERDSGICKDFTLFYAINQASVNIVFTGIDDNSKYINVTKLPLLGSLMTKTTAVAIVTGTLYKKEEVTYAIKTNGNDSFSFSTNQIDTPCTVTIKSCYSSCASCTESGDSVNHKCSKCLDGFYSLEDKSANCFKGTDNPPEGYYLVPGVGFKKCYSLCKTCTWYPEKPDINMSCNSNSCTTNYYPKVNNMTSCFTGILPQYYFDGKIYQKCYFLCDSCDVAGTDTNNQCKTCIKDYFPKEDDMTNCFTGLVEDYYFDDITNIYRKCEPKKCKKRCYDSCNKCSDQGDEKNHKCISCSDGFVQLEDDKSFCYMPDNGPKGYYYDKEKNVFRKCYKSCAECTEGGTIKKPNCTKCAGAEEFCKGCTDYTFKDTCMKKCPASAVTDDTSRECIECAKDILYENQCLDKCPDGVIKKGNSCETCLSLNKLYYNGSCVDTCPGYLIANTKNICVELDINLDLESN